MLDLATDIRSLSEFKRNTVDLLARVIGLFPVYLSAI